MVGKLNKCVEVRAGRLTNQFATFDGSNLAEEGQDQVFGDGDVQVSYVERLGPARIDIAGIHHSFMS